VAGTTVRYNWVHDHNAFNWGGIGIRGDDRTRGLIVHHNVAWRCPEKGIITKGDRNRIYNNTCFDNPMVDICVPRDRLPGKIAESEVQNSHSETVNNAAPVISGYYPWQRRRGKDAPPLGEVASNYRGRDPMLADPANLDFRPRAGSPLIDAGQTIPGITDGYKGKAPDIGAYEFGALRWVPGYRNAVWLLQGKGDVRVRLAMPTLEPVAVQVGEQNLTFKPSNWLHCQTVKGAAGTVRVAIPRLGLDAAATPEGPGGAMLPFRTIP
jgi:hypothetical protein